ncbi:hypothetical protein EV128_101899 [Rhizobium azibense]|nr:hypothetical protein EV128_101899 [Rhizobium azibense]
MERGPHQMADLSLSRHRVADHRIVPFGILQHRKMAGILQDDEPAARRASVPAAVGDYHKMVFGKILGLTAPDIGTAEALKDEQDRIARTLLGVIHLDVVYWRHAARLRRRHGREGGQLRPALGRPSACGRESGRKEQRDCDCNCAHDLLLKLGGFHSRKEEKHSSRGEPSLRRRKDALRIKRRRASGGTLPDRSRRSR